MQQRRSMKSSKGGQTMANLRVINGGLSNVGAVNAYPINDYQYALDICGKHIVLTYLNLKRKCRDRKLLTLVRILLGISGTAMMLGFMFAVGTIGHSDMLIEMGLPDDMTFMEESIRLGVSMLISGVSGFFVGKFYKAEQVLIERLEG